MSRLLSLSLVLSSACATAPDHDLSATASRLASLTGDPAVRDGLRARLGKNRSIALDQVASIELGDGRRLGDALATDQHGITLALGPVAWTDDQPILVGSVPVGSDQLTLFDVEGHATEHPAADAPTVATLMLVPDEALVVVPDEPEPDPVANATASSPVYFRELVIRATHETLGSPEIFSICNQHRDDYSSVNDADEDYIVDNYLANTPYMYCWIMEDDWGSASYGDWDSGDDLLGTLEFDTAKLATTSGTKCLEVSNFDAIGSFSRARAPNVSPYVWMVIRQPCTSFVQ